MPSSCCSSQDTDIIHIIILSGISQDQSEKQGGACLLKTLPQYIHNYNKMSPQYLIQSVSSVTLRITPNLRHI